MNLDSLIGWHLREAREVLSQNESTRTLYVQVVETRAPGKKIDAQIERFGGWRILDAQSTGKSIELVVAREQVVD